MFFIYLFFLSPVLWKLNRFWRDPPPHFFLCWMGNSMFFILLMIPSKFYQCGFWEERFSSSFKVRPRCLSGNMNLSPTGMQRTVPGMGFQFLSWVNVLSFTVHGVPPCHFLGYWSELLRTVASCPVPAAWVPDSFLVRRYIPCPTASSRPLRAHGLPVITIIIIIIMIIIY